MSKFQVSALIEGHESDVRSLTTCYEQSLFSTSRDGTTRWWSSSSSSGPVWAQRRVWERSVKEFINSCCFIPSDPAGYLLTGGQDGIIECYPVRDGDDFVPVSFPAHAANICRLTSHSKDALVASSSWDSSARIWSVDLARLAQSKDDALSQLYCFEHPAAVWDTMIVELDRFKSHFVTACADGLTRLWKREELKLTCKGHEGPVRSLAKLLPGDPDCHLFASASNDGTIRIWDLEGNAITKLDGHDSFIYSIVCLADDRLVSSGEDGIVRVWSRDDGDLEQEILVPATSVWCLTALPNGDLAMGCSDHRIWVFTQAHERRASKVVADQYQEMMQHFKSSRPKKEAVAQVANEQREQMSHDGQLYDFVFDIDVKDDEPALKLPYNVADDPVETARSFVQEHGLSENYIDRIVDFIRMHVDAVK